MARLRVGPPELAPVNNLLARIPEERDVMQLPKPKASLAVENVSVAPRA